MDAHRPGQGAGHCSDPALSPPGLLSLCPLWRSSSGCLLGPPASTQLGRCTTYPQLLHHPPRFPRSFSKAVTTQEGPASFFQLRGFPTPLTASPLRPGPSSGPELPVATSEQPSHSSERVKVRPLLYAVNLGFSPLIAETVICISLLCAGLSSSLSVGPGPCISIPGSYGCAPAVC